MDNDLNIKACFDGLHDVISKLDCLRKKGMLSLEDASAALKNLQRVDRVLQVLF